MKNRLADQLTPEGAQLALPFTLRDKIHNQILKEAIDICSTKE